MKMAKKLLAVVLTGVMALSMLTGCAGIASRQVADELEDMLKVANDKATVKVDKETLANNAVKVAKTEQGALKETDALKTAVEAELKKDVAKDTYVWYTCVETKDLNKTTKAQKIANVLITIESNKAKINTTGAVNGADVKVDGKSDNIKAGNKFELSMKEFTVKETVNGKDTNVDYVMVVVTCKAVVAEAQG